MVDVATYNIMYGYKAFRDDKVYESIYDKWPQKLDATRDIPTDCELFLPDVIEGFHLGSKKWGKWLVSYHYIPFFEVNNDS